MIKLITLFCTITLLMLSSRVVAEPNEPLPKQEQRISVGCAVKAEQAFYIAQEKLYNYSNVKNLKEFLKKNLTATEYTLQAKNLLNLEGWVDEYLSTKKDKPLATDVARALFYTCIKNSYEIMNVKPTQELRKYLFRFEEYLSTVTEDYYPYSQKKGLSI